MNLFLPKEDEKAASAPDEKNRLMKPGELYRFNCVKSLGLTVYRENQFSSNSDKAGHIINGNEFMVLFQDNEFWTHIIVSEKQVIGWIRAVEVSEMCNFLKIEKKAVR